MSRILGGGLGALTVALAGCQVPITAPRPAVTIVETRTPGVAFVIVAPSMNQAHTPQSELGKRTREYILICDARPADGMHCAIPQEAALVRASEHPQAGKAPVAVDAEIGSLPAVTVQKLGEKGSAAGDTPLPVGAPPAPSPAPVGTGGTK